jgi:glycolate oxidase iron-sulfur subunit
MPVTFLPDLSEEQYLNCNRCGLCLSVCPTYREYLSETSSPRGRVALARKGLQNELGLSRNLFAQMYACFNCLACNQICPVGIHPANLALAMRQIEGYRYPFKFKRALLGSLTLKPEQIELTSWLFRIYRQMGKFLTPQLRALAKMLPQLPSNPARKTLPEINSADGESRYRVAYFLGCAQNLIFANQSRASLRVLTANHCTVIVPKRVVCCGMPLRSFGLQEILLDCARHNISLFEDLNVDVIITDCATCGSTLKEYGRFLADDNEWADRASLFSQKVQDISEFLLNIPLKKPNRPIEFRITYHDPCHLRRGQGVWQQPRQLLKMIPGLEFVELPESDWCCGSAGSQLLTHYQTSLKVLDRKMDAIENTRAEVIASGCPGCQMQLSVGVWKRQMEVQITHPISLLSQAYDQDETDDR